MAASVVSIRRSTRTLRLFLTTVCAKHFVSGDTGVDRRRLHLGLVSSRSQPRQIRIWSRPQSLIRCLRNNGPFFRPGYAVACFRISRAGVAALCTLRLPFSVILHCYVVGLFDPHWRLDRHSSKATAAAVVAAEFASTLTRLFLIARGDCH